MKNKISIRGLLSALCLVAIVSIPVALVIDKANINVRRKESCRFRKTFLLAQRVKDFRSAHGGVKPEKISDALEGLSPDEKRDYLSASGVEQGWKPAGWYTNQAVIDVFSDYVLLATKSGKLYVSERPGLFGDSRIAVFGTEKFMCGDNFPSTLFGKIFSIKEFQIRLESDRLDNRPINKSGCTLQMLSNKFDAKTVGVDIGKNITTSGSDTSSCDRIFTDDLIRFDEDAAIQTYMEMDRLKAERDKKAKEAENVR